MGTLAEKGGKSGDGNIQMSACDTQSFRWTQSIRSWIIDMIDGLNE